jgi:predicted RNA-binding protein
MAKAYQTNKTEEPFLTDIAYIKFNGDRLELRTLFGELKEIQGKVSEIDFVKSKVIIEP